MSRLKPAKNIMGCFSKVGVSTAFISIMKNTKGFCAVKEDKTQKLEVKSDGEKGDTEAKGYNNMFKKARVDNDRGHGRECKADAKGWLH